MNAGTKCDIPIDMTIASASHTSDHRARISGTVLGIVVFLIGVALLGYVFATARTLFDAPSVIPAAAFAVASPAPAGATVAAAPAAPAATALIGQSLTSFLQKLLVLLLMCIAGSVIASQGINLFFKTLAAPRLPHSLVADAAPALPPA
jgi:hypothetical protein